MTSRQQSAAHARVRDVVCVETCRGEERDRLTVSAGNRTQWVVTVHRAAYTISPWCILRLFESKYKCCSETGRQDRPHLKNGFRCRRYQLMLLFWVSFVLRKDKHGSRPPTVILSATALAKFPAPIPEIGTLRGHSISQGASGADTKSNILCPWAGAALSILQRPHFFSSPVPNMR